MQKSRFLFRRNKKFSSGSLSDHKQVRAAVRRQKQLSGSDSKPSPPTQSVSLDSGRGQSRLNILRKNIFRKRHRPAPAKLE